MLSPIENETALKALYYAPNYAYCESNSAEVGVQCLLIRRRGAVDPTRLPYRDRIRWRLKQFCMRTSSHGIPWLGRNWPNKIYRVIWIFLLCVSMSMFLNQARRVISRYQRNDKITDIQLNFETASFPAITVCSLNPYLESLLKDVEAIKKIFNVYNNVMLKATRHNEQHIGDIPAGVRQAATEGQRFRRQAETTRSTTFFEPAYAGCTCGESEFGDEECTPNVTAVPSELDDKTSVTCMCAFDRESSDAWPCYPKEKWSEVRCGYCDWKQYCTADPKTGFPPANRPCYCQSVDPFCVSFNESIGILKLWEYHGYYAEEKKIIESLGFQNMSDEVAIVTKAKENMIFAMSELTEQQRIALSVKKHQLILKCSFNGVACDIDKDFSVIADPTFGNCYTFNYRRNETKWSSRAGAQHGLRMMVFVNTTEYLPITEAVGVRITIHDKDEFPFPDTFGLYAPTGYVSSFGMKLSKMSRLSAPFGDCRSPYDTDDGRYIYAGFRYSTEGCYRSCFQQLVIKNCGCGDPRFPVLGAPHCEVFDPDARKCLEQQTSRLGNIDENKEIKCHCPHPCEQSVYSVSYSAANWPSQSLNISSTVGRCPRGRACDQDYFKENGAMIEVFYEALNFETFKESEAYGLVKMMADFGGQLGLWSGVSFMTCCEFIFLFAELAYIVVQYHWRKLAGKRRVQREQAKK